jgi:glycerol-3-phosphate O-acyltransferase
VQNLANRVLTGINEVAIGGSVALVSLILLATRQRALPEDELIAHIDIFQKIAKQAPYSADARLPDLAPKAIIESAEIFGKLSRFTHPGGDVIHAVEPQASYIVYYRNNVAHLYALISVIAYFLQHNDSIKEDVIREGVRTIYPVLRREFFLRWEDDAIDGLVSKYVGVLVELGLFVRAADGRLTRPDMTSFEFNILRTLGLIVGPALERFAIATHLLNQYRGGATFKMEDFQKRCLMMAQRISLLTGAADVELPSAHVFTAIVEQLSERGLIEKVGEHDWRLTAVFPEILNVTSALLSVDMRQSMARAKG